MEKGLWEVRLKHPEDEDEVGIFLNAADEQEARTEGLAAFNNADGYIVTLALPISYAMIPGCRDVLHAER